MKDSRRLMRPISTSLSQGNYIGAYVIAFSIFEDRINAMYATRKHLQRGRYPTPHSVYNTSFKRRLKVLKNAGDIEQTIRNDWKICANDRNEKLHAAMWNINEFKKKDAEAVLKRSREADKLRKQQKSKEGV